MNETIKQLKQQAIETVDILDIANMPIEQYRDEIDIKFAELIIHECINQIKIERGNPYRNMGDDNRYGINACDESIRRIKQQFDIKQETPYQIGQRLYQTGKGISDVWGAVGNDSDIDECLSGYNAENRIKPE